MRDWGPEPEVRREIDVTDPRTRNLVALKIGICLIAGTVRHWDDQCEAEALARRVRDVHISRVEPEVERLAAGRLRFVLLASDEESVGGDPPNRDPEPPVTRLEVWRSLTPETG